MTVVLIAIERYAGTPEWNRLTGPVSDALALAAWLITKGVDPASIHVRMSARDEATATADFTNLGVTDLGQATRAAIRSLFVLELPKWPAGELIVFWSGHGWFAENSLCLSSSEGRNEDMNLIDIDSLLQLLRSDTVKQFKSQNLFFDACAKFKPGKSAADDYPAGNPLKEIDQNSYYAASPGQAAIEAAGKGLFNHDFWQRLHFPFQPRQIRGELEDIYDAAVQSGVAMQRPFTVGHSLASAKPTWRGTRPRADFLTGFARRSGLTPKLLERLAITSARCPSFASVESRDALAQSLAQAAARPFNRPDDIKSPPALDFQMLWAFAREQNLGPQLLNEMDEKEMASNEMADVQDYLDAAARIAELLEIVATLGIPSRIWRAWVDEYSTSSEWSSQYDLEDLLEPFFLNARTARKRRLLLELLARAWRRRNSSDLLAWLRARPDWQEAFLTTQVPPRQIVHLDAGFDPEKGVWIDAVKLWRPRTRSYRNVDLAALGLDAARVPSIAQQFDGLDQELTAKGLIAPEITEIIYELALPAPALNLVASHQPRHAVAFRWLDRLRTREKSMGAGDWVRFGEAINLRRNDPEWKPRGTWLPAAKCSREAVLAQLQTQGADARELIGLACTIGATPENLAQLLDILRSGAPFACWHIVDPPAWDPLEPEVQKLLDDDGLDSLPLALRGARRSHNELAPMVLFFDDPLRDPYGVHLGGLGT